MRFHVHRPSNATDRLFSMSPPNVGYAGWLAGCPICCSLLLKALGAPAARSRPGACLACPISRRYGSPCSCRPLCFIPEVSPIQDVHVDSSLLLFSLLLPATVAAPRSYFSSIPSPSLSPAIDIPSPLNCRVRAPAFARLSARISACTSIWRSGNVSSFVVKRYPRFLWC
ncbi:hypothetical protein EJ04DRAFT_60616 [Polyplosphaeria fusca]|uniref:Uncharacterized protein n=1 Tax=Polyplosphaeria fusca TaxID=682080 RepID=A0A9P4R539_9PLEO|nr:hypothetical protein EJ04DRAFT_60616 [Polyplosphaeria fusca]